MKKLLLLGCLTLTTACSPLEATPRQGAVESPVQPAARNTPLNFQTVPECPSDWSYTIWVNTTPDQVDNIKAVSGVDAVYCSRFVGNSDSERTPEQGVMVKLTPPNLSSKIPKDEKNLTPEEAKKMIAETEQIQINSEAEANKILQKLTEIGYEAALGSLG